MIWDEEHAGDVSDAEFQKSLVEAIHEASPDGILVVDGQGVIVSQNRRMLEVWGIDPEEVPSLPDGRLAGLPDQGLLTWALEQVVDRESFLNRVQELYAEPALEHLSEIELIDGRTLERHSRALWGQGGRYLGRVWFFRDITVHKQNEQALEELSNRDSLTGAAKRRHFFERAAEEIARCNRFGHELGDQVLVEFTREVRAALEGGAHPDYLTLSGSGEPTLHSGLGQIVKRLKDMSDVPVALVTNASLLHRPDVRADCAELNLMLPSLDAGDAKTFRRLNRPHSGIELEDIIRGLCAVRRETEVGMWLEVFVVPGINTGDEQVEALARAVERIGPDRVQLNTAVRPPAEEHIRPASRETLEWMRTRIGPNCEIVAEPEHAECVSTSRRAAEDILSTLRRRPSTAEDVATGLSLDEEEVRRELERLRRAGKVGRFRQEDTVYYRAEE